jgi:hypothetical protein
VEPKTWAVIEGDTGVHVIPDNDLVDHTEVDCVCVPQDQSVIRDDGSIGWVMVHASLDGRELEETRQ